MLRMLPPAQLIAFWIELQSDHDEHLQMRRTPTPRRYPQQQGRLFVLQTMRQMNIIQPCSCCRWQWRGNSQLQASCG